MSGTENESGQPRKRVRKSGWDIPGPVGTVAPVVGFSAPSSLVDDIGESNAAFLAQQIALQRAQQAALLIPVQGGVRTGHRIYVGSIHYDLKESDMVALFSSFGAVTKSEMTIDPATGRTKGFCFLEFGSAAEADAAMAMDGFELAGRKIKVGRPFHGQGAAAAPVVTPSNMFAGLGLPPVVAPVPSALNSAAQLALLKLTSSLAGGGGGFSGGLVVNEVMTCVLVKNITSKVTLEELRPIFEAFGTVTRIAYVEASRVPDSAFGTQSAIVEFDTPATAKTVTDGLNNFPLDGVNISLSVVSQSRANKLLEVDTSTFRRVVLQDMVTYEDTLDPDLNEEVSEEARNYGTLEKVDITVDDKREATVVLLYAEPSDAAKALKAMNGRAFGGKKIRAVLAL